MVKSAGVDAKEDSKRASLLAAIKYGFSVEGAVCCIPRCTPISGPFSVAEPETQVEACHTLRKVPEVDVVTSATNELGLILNLSYKIPKS